MKLADWLDEYRTLPAVEVTRRSGDEDDDWEEPELIASPDRVRDTTPRWLKRAERAGYGRVSGL